LISHDLTVVEVEHGREIELLALYVELGHVCNPPLIRPFCVELALQDVRRSGMNLAAIGAVFLGSYQRLKAH
jgi:hypothetical protein